MRSPARGLVRLGRAAAVAVVVLGLAGGAHAAAGGELPSPLLAVLLLVLTAWASLLATRWRLSRTGALVLLGAGQWVLHHALVVAARSSAGQVVAPPSGHADHASGLLPEHLPAAAEHAVTESAAMALGHAAATVVAALLLARGDRALWALWAWLRPLRVPPSVVHGPVPARPSARRDAPLLTPRGVVVLTGRPRRGPPALLGSAAPAPS